MRTWTQRHPRAEGAPHSSARHAPTPPLLERGRRRGPREEEVEDMLVVVVAAAPAAEVPTGGR